MPVRRLEVGRVLCRARAGPLRDRVEVGSDVGVKHRKFELEVRQPDRRPGTGRRLKRLELDLVRLAKASAGSVSSTDRTREGSVARGNGPSCP